MGIMQALGKDHRRTQYKDLKPGRANANPSAPAPQARQWREPWREKTVTGTPAPMATPAAAASAASAPSVASAASSSAVKHEQMEFEEDEDEFAKPEVKVKVQQPAPPAGTKVIRVHATGVKQQTKTEPKAKAAGGYRPIAKAGAVK